MSGGLPGASTNPLGLPDEALLERPSPLAELLGDAPIHVTRVDLAGAEWGRWEGHHVGLRSLPAGAQVKAYGHAIAWLKGEAKLSHEDLFGDMGSASLEIETRVQILSQALVSTAPPHARLVKGPADVRDRFTSEQVVWLFERFEEVQQARSPIKALTDPAKVKELADALGKGFLPTTSLKSYDTATVRRITTELVSLLLRQTPPSSSGTSSPST